MDDAIYNKDGTTDESIKFKIRIYNLLKQLSGLQMLSVSDELEMMNYLKTNNFVSKKTFMIKILVQLKGKKINQRVLDKLAEDNYMKYMTCDIIARYLITLQTSKNIYQIKNNLTNSNYIGWPLINSDKDDLSGVNMMLVFINQISLNETFSYLNSGSGGLSGLKKLLMDRISNMVDTDSFIRNKLETSLDKKYNDIEFLMEQKTNITNYWLQFRPPLEKANLTWNPTKELSMDIIKNFTGKIIHEITDYANQNIYYCGQKIINQLFLTMKNERPTRGYIGSIANTCLPIDISELNKTKITSDDNDLNSMMDKKLYKLSEIEKQKTISKIEKNSSTVNYMDYINSKINFYSQIDKSGNIDNSIKTIEKYNNILQKLHYKISQEKCKIIYPFKENYNQSKININMSDEELSIFFLQYIDSGIYKGNFHLFDNFGRCLYTNQLKEDVVNMTYNQAEFEKLLKYVNKKNVLQSNEKTENKNVNIDKTKYYSSVSVIRFMNILELLIDNNSNMINNKNKKNIKKIENHVIDAIEIKLITELEYSLQFSHEFEAIIIDLETLDKLFTKLQELKDEIKIQMDKKNNLVLFLEVCFNKALLVCINLIHELFAKYLNVLLLPKQDRDNSKKELFKILSDLDQQIQNNTADVSEVLANDKEEESSLENTIISIGNLSGLNRDYKSF